MNLKLFLFFSFSISFIFYSCRKDDINFSISTNKLGLSNDTIILDTVYNQMRSSTYIAKIYNLENKDILIPKIYLEQGLNSLYRINVDGKSGYDFTNIPLRANDSLFIFIEIAPNINSKEIIFEDKIKIENNINSQHITLLSVIQDAEFIISSIDNPKIISNDTYWDNSKVKIILGEVNIAENTTLSIEKGTKVYFMPNSGIRANKNSTLNINGDLDNEVIFRGHRNEPRYDTIPKNWNAIIIDEGAKINMNYAILLGGTTGLYLNHANAKIKNSILHTFQDYGIFAINSHIDSENMVINNSRIASLGVVKGGTYNIIHSTIANYWKISNSSALSIYAQNYWINTNGIEEISDLNLNFKNSIAYTRKNNAIQLVAKNNANFNYYFENSLIKHSSDSGFTWDNNTNIVNSLVNKEPNFINHNIKNMNLRVSDNSPAKKNGNPLTAKQIPNDIKKINRTINPTIGAYQ